MSSFFIFILLDTFSKSNINFHYLHPNFYHHMGIYGHKLFCSSMISELANQNLVWYKENLHSTAGRFITSTFITNHQALPGMSHTISCIYLSVTKPTNLVLTSVVFLVEYKVKRSSKTTRVQPQEMNIYLRLKLYLKTFLGC